MGVMTNRYKNYFNHVYHAASLMIYQGILIPPISQVTQVQCMAKCMIVIEKEVIVCIDGITIFLLKNPPPPWRGILYRLHFVIWSLLGFVNRYQKVVFLLPQVITRKKEKYIFLIFECRVKGIRIYQQDNL